MRALATLLLAATALVSVPPSLCTAHAASTESSRGGIAIPAGTGRVLHLRTAATNIFTADPKVAEVRPASPDSLFVWGVAPGTTTVAALTDKGETVAQFQVTVTPSGYSAKQTATDIGHAAIRPSVKVRETQAGLAISGTVPTPADADRAVNAAKAELPGDAKLDNNLKVNGSVQVSLHVRIAEMSRTLTRELGVNWCTINANLGNCSSFARLGQHVAAGVSTNNPVQYSTINPTSAALQLVHNWNLETVIQALSEDQLVHLLAEPNLTTMSGEPANFLVGGEFPIPVATAQDTISVEFKQYGISLSFVPTVLNKDNILLHVRPEVSQLDKANGVTFFFGAGNNGAGLSIPALTVRRADTTVQLGSGQSFVIAGLLQDQTTMTGNGVPGLGDIPILGALFRSDSFQRDQDELVIVVTPYIVSPVNDPNALKLPTDGWRPPTDIERILYLRQSAPGYAGTVAPMRRIPADAGFMVE
ncbi:MAG TPA: type II and III secretion system protein family protein [Acetobacteraceae bacterium]|nr:type II and III secretion system protein family protein [Acetobacteraceae bacterium]